MYLWLSINYMRELSRMHSLEFEIPWNCISHSWAELENIHHKTADIVKKHCERGTHQNNMLAFCFVYIPSCCSNLVEIYRYSIMNPAIWLAKLLTIYQPIHVPSTKKPVCNNTQSTQNRGIYLVVWSGRWYDCTTSWFLLKQLDYSLLVSMGWELTWSFTASSFISL